MERGNYHGTGNLPCTSQRSGSCQSSQGKLHFPCAGCRQLPLCGLAAWKHLALQAVPVQQVICQPMLFLPKQTKK